MMVRKLLRALGLTLGALVILLCLAIVLTPAFLDRIYYRGPVSAHFDGEHFANPDNDEDTIRLPAGSSRAGFFWRYLTGNDGRPAWPDHVAVQQTKPAARVMGDTMVATWIGHATVLVQTNGLNILTDPIYAEKAGPLGFGPQRVAAPGVKFEDLPKIDLVIVSHDHYDHMDLATLKKLWERDQPTIITSLGNETLIRSTGAKATAADWGQEIRIPSACDRTRAVASNLPIACDGPVSVVVTRNHHWGSRWFTDRNRALWSSFVIKLPGGNIFFAGDTGFGDGQWPVEAAKLGPIRLALIPIGAFRFQDGQMQAGSHIGPIQAAEVYARLGASHAIPIHWGTFRLSWEAYDTPPKLLAAVTRCRGQSGFDPAVLGQPVEIPLYAKPMPAKSLDAACLAPAARAFR
jgi:L-ascorbate metabolism protein UlaG (beta-lactamase superfamily)